MEIFQLSHLKPNNMKQNINPLIVILGSCLLTACASTASTFDTNLQIPSQIHSEIAADFAQANTEGVLLFQKNNQIVITGNQVNRVDQRFIPASTFKILNALIALEYQKTNPTEVFKWDGQPRAYPHWQKDMTMVEAMQLSTVPVYQEIAKRIGSELMQAELKRVHYGNEKMGNVIDRFWLDGPLEITPRQSLDFIAKLSTHTLPFKLETQQTIKEMLLIESHTNYTLYGKTGWGTAQPYDVGWLVGWIETSKGKVIPYVLNMQMKDGMNPNIRKELVLKAIQGLGIK